MVMLESARGVHTICQWGHSQDPVMVKTLGFADGVTSGHAPLHRICQDPDQTALEQALADGMRAQGDGSAQAGASRWNGARVYAIRSWQPAPVRWRIRL